ncbi:MAG: glyoxalase [Flavobacteriaceae bacterium]|nr:glyoxalase [Flavobacteriaceae bacterium]
MDHRDDHLVNMRPDLGQARMHDQMSSQEFFQNNTLRPILKLQNDLILALFRHYVEKHKGVFYELSPERKMDYIESAIHKDMKFRNILKGLVLGQFTLEEYRAYSADSSAINKRILSMIKERLKSQVQVLSQG